MTDRPRCYVASPLGFSEAGRHYYAEVYLPALSAVVEPVDPWSLTQPWEVEQAIAAGRERDIFLEIGRRNSEAIRSCTLLAAHLDGQEVDAGTAAEIGYGVAAGLTCFGLRTDLRQSGEPGMVVNLQVEAFIVESGGRVVDSLDALVAALATPD
ncbi:MAG: nucleoside 2-deoxyribosyltransferase [Solirubrobacteraceae bacterium]|nr:nucleoside 2-deoxyribosyltransferase [Solirubrobacteraceae bacterium]